MSKSPQAGPWPRPSPLVFLTVGSAIGLLSFIRGWFDTLAGGAAHSAWPILLDELSAAWLAAIGLWLCSLIWRHYPPSRMSSYPVIVVLAPVFALAHTLSIYASRSLLYPVLGFGEYDYGDLTYRLIMEAPVQLAVYAVTLGLFVYLERGYALRDRERLQAQLTEARLDALRLKLAPHFLFNAMNTISSVVYQDPAEADALIGRLSRILRALLNAQPSHRVSLNKEFALLDEYLAIQKARFKERLSYQLDCPDTLGDQRVPFMILQPLVENALKHGQDENGRVQVQVHAERGHEQLALQVIDSGDGSQFERQGKGVGLSNVRERLLSHYGESASLSLTRDGTNHQTIATVLLPCV